jgi:guanine deaminase
MADLTQDDQKFLRRAIEISRNALEDQGKTPFGAIVVVGNEIIGEGTSSVVELLDVSAHAEIMALRNAGAKLQGHLMKGATLYSSSEPCPMCLAACYWARVSRVVFGATSHDVATYGFEDLQLYQELSRPSQGRSLREDPADDGLREQAVAALRAWTEQLPQPVTPKY